MKPVESENTLKNMNNSDEQKKQDEPLPSSSKLDPNSPDSEQTKDDLFEPTVDMLVNDFDEEQTLEEEEALAAKDGHDPGAELSDLQRESEMPIEELLKLYGCAPPMVSSTSSSRKRRRRGDRSPPPPKQSKKSENPTEPEASGSVQVAEVPAAAEESPDEDAMTTTTNNPENTSLNDDETNYEDEEEPSELKKLYNDGDKIDATLSDEEDVDYVPEEEEGKKTIMVGADYQALIPEGLRKYDDALPYENEDKLLWDPSKINDGDLEEYLNKFSTTSNGTNASQAITNLRDDEQALLLLLQCGNNSDEALRRRGLGAMPPTNRTSIFSEEECRNFENGIKLYGKCFHEIQASKVKTRSVGELVEFYYLWKKTERADQFANKTRLEKKKYTFNQNVTDVMEKYLEEYDGTNRERDRSASPNVNSLLQTDMKRSHRSSANNSTGDSNDHKVIKQQVQPTAPLKDENSDPSVNTVDQQ